MHTHPGTHVKAMRPPPPARVLAATRGSPIPSLAGPARFVAQLSHEVRTPLHGILGLASLLKGSRLDPTQRQWVGMLERSGEHLCALISDVLDVSRLQAGQLPVRPRCFDLALLLDDLVAMQAAVATTRGLKLASRLRIPRPAMVLGDPTRVRQILDNLIGNALKFTDKGQVAVSVERAGDGTMAFDVTDQGIGIAPQDIARIFEPFEQVHGEGPSRPRGTGLGLTIARGLAHAMGGDITCHSRLGEGSTFRFTALLPPAASANEDHVTAPGGRNGAPDTPGMQPDAPTQSEKPQVSLSPTGTRPETRPSLRTDVCRVNSSGLPAARWHGLGAAQSGGRSGARTVLVAEDDPVNALLARAALQAEGLEVDVAHDGAQAIERWRSQTYDLILMDCHMPGMDGIAATRRIRAIERAEGRLPATIIALTADASEADGDRCRAAGMDGHLPKPFAALQLRRLLRQHLRA